MRVLTEEEYLALHGAPHLEGAEPALHRLPGGLPKSRKGKIMEKVHSRMLQIERRRDELRQLYADEVEAGTVRPPSRVERLRRTAQGHPDNESVQAARRLLKKMGYSWESNE